MKIGAFARKFHVSVSAIRFYMQNGLLIPTRKGGQYEFDQKCAQDMEKILRYKKYSFSIEEMQHLFLLENASNYRDNAVTEIALNILRQKKEELIEARNQLTESIKEIETEIHSYPMITAQNTPQKDLPLSIIPYLSCPHCGAPLQMGSAEIAEGNIHSGQLSCTKCNAYHARIADGVILCESYTEDTPLKGFDNIDTLISISEQSSPAYRMLIRKAYIWMYNCSALRLNEPAFIMTGPFSFNFLLTYMDKINKDSTVIFCDPSLNKIRKLKLYFSSCEPNIIYIAGMPADIPLRKNCIDIYFDDYSMTDFCFSFGSFPAKDVSSLLKKNCDIYGIFTNYQKAPKTLEYFRSINPSFDPARMNFNELKNKWSFQNIQIEENEVIGSAVINEDFYPRNAHGEQVEVHAYSARKKSG